jgi:MFS family permease
MTDIAAPNATKEHETRLAIRFLNWAHAIDHYVMLIFPTVVIGLEAVYGRPYAELIALGTASFVAFGVFSLPAGWLADRWSRRNMMALFFVGCGLSLAGAALAPNLYTLAAALFVLGMFAAIYHPVGMAMLIEASQARGRTLAFNGVCGNLGAALAAGITAVLASIIGWRGAFLVPAVLCVITGIVYLSMTPDDRHHIGKRKSAPAVKLSQGAMLAMFACFIVVALTAGLVFNMISVSLPKIVDERLAGGSPLYLVGGIATAVFMCGALAQLSVGRLTEKFTAHGLFAVIVLLQLIGIYWAAHASGISLLLALALSMAAIYGQVTVNDIVIARYTADAWRGRVYAVRYFLIFITSGVGVGLIALLYRQGGFDLVLMVNAAVTLLLVLAVIGIVSVITLASPKPAQAAQPAE